MVDGGQWTVEVRRWLGGGEQKVKGAKGSGEAGPSGEMTLTSWNLRLPHDANVDANGESHVRGLSVASLINTDLLPAATFVEYTEL